MKDKKGTVPLYVRATVGGTVRYASLGLRIPERHWNAKAGEVRKTNPDHARLNQYLIDVKAAAQSVLADLLANGQKVTAPRIRDGLRARLEGREEEQAGDFLAYCVNLLSVFERRGQIATHRVYRTAVRKLRDYVRPHRGWSELPFDEITVPLMRGFQTYLIEEVGNKPNTVHKNVTSIRTLLYYAIKDGLFPQERNPFFQITLRKEKVQKDKLDIEEIEALEALELEPETLIWHVRNWFLFAFYAGGMRFSDVA
ncbi:MAG: phage integrase SAM-like domain and Arm DNA-binding domain-containing protein, partial [Nitrospirae bacterium]|nr:phage integrase SAM-like domain and Arm DNA-binding domain-containing protein [Nitrospirota bacterium]